MALFLIGTVLLLLLLTYLYQGIQTLSALDQIERERDHWQRPSDVIQALDLKPGNVVVDLGCGSGYFTLKLSATVGQRRFWQRIRRLPLMFLWIRTFQSRQHNVSLVLGEPNDPQLPLQGVNAVLIANTYHEFTNSQAILVHVVRSLGSGGRLVVVDREPRAIEKWSTGTSAEHHEVSSSKLKMNFDKLGLRSSVVRIISLRMIPLTRNGG